MNAFIKTAVCAALFACGTAQAHYIWLEADDTGARLYFGEADVLVKEKSPGKLDNIKSPQAFTVDAAGKRTGTALERKQQYFAAASGKYAALVASEESLDVRDLSKSNLGIAKPNYYARNGQPAADAASALPLDVAAGGANSFTVLYRGQPLKDAKLEVIAPNTWVQEHTTDANGAVRINTPWRGQYVLHVLHVDRTPGEFGGKKYDNVRSHFTYSFMKPDGADPGPAIPPQHREN